MSIKTVAYIALLSLCYALTGVHCDQHRHMYTMAHVNIEVRKFRDVSIALFGQYSGEMLDNVLAKSIDESHHGVTVDPKTGSETMRLRLYLSEDKYHFFATTPGENNRKEKPLMAMHTELLMRSTETTATIFFKSKNSQQRRKVCGKMLAPLPETPEEMFHAILNIGSSGGFNTKCSDQQNTDDCRMYPVCKAKTRFYQFKSCAAKHAWNSDNVFKRCADANVCYETKIGAELQAHLKETAKKVRFKQSGLAGQKLHQSAHHTMVQREKSIITAQGGELRAKSTIFKKVERSFDGWDGEDIFDSATKKLWLLNKFPGLTVEFMSCNDVLSLVEIDSKVESKLTSEEKVALSEMKALTYADMQTKHGVKKVGKFLLTVLGGMALVAVGFAALIVLFALIKLAFVVLAVAGTGVLLGVGLAWLAMSVI